MSSISGKYLTVMIGSTVLAGNHEWTCDETADKLEATVGADQGRGKKDPGVVDTSGRIVFYLDVTSGAYTAVRAGGTVSNLKLYAVASSTLPLYSFTTAKLFGSKVRGTIRDRFIVEVEYEAYGNVVTSNEPN